MKITNNIGKWRSLTVGALDNAMSRMTVDIKQIASITIPYKTGELQDSIENKKVAQLRHRVLIDKAYASYQERGLRADGSRVVRNYSTGGTSSKFLKKAGERVKKDAINYIKQANQAL